MCVSSPSLFIFSIRKLTLVVYVSVQRASASLRLITLSLWTTPHTTASSLPSNTPEMKRRKAQKWIDGWKEKEGYTERDWKWMWVRERTKGVSGKGLNFPREALSERERERGNTLRLALERRKAFFFSSPQLGSCQQALQQTASRGKLWRSFPKLHFVYSLTKTCKQFHSTCQHIGQLLCF